ncbi:MAG: hypothetical protein LBQ97_08715 [Fusobacteriaceae bacterium]|jgi:hypothetical protein|nr:hypothetical protein [Fusobacteriaceae bacterium]
MKKNYLLAVAMLLSLTVFAANSGLGIVTDADLLKVGVTRENIELAKKTIETVSVKYKMTLLDKKQAELEINKYVLEGSEKNRDKIFALFDKMGAIEAQILKDRLDSQIEIRRYITQDQYMAAREEALERLGSGEEQQPKQ